MFCNQCEQTVNGIGCSKVGVCSKPPVVSNTMDYLIHVLRMYSLVALEARSQKIINREFDKLTCSALFSTLTNVNFSTKDLKNYITRLTTLKEELEGQMHKETKITVSMDVEDYCGKDTFEYRPDHFNENKDIQSLMQTIVFGLKGIAAYMSHCFAFDKYNDEVIEFMYKALAAGYDGKERTLNDWIELTLEVGKWNFETMKLLDEANNTLGHPNPSEVTIGHIKGKCILISGHDLHDLHLLLEQSKDKNVNIYTHGEMIAAHAYPELKKYKHLVGHFGTAWQNQQKELPHFPGAILFTTNCLMKPLDSYKERVFTTNEVGYDGLHHIQMKENTKDFSEVIEKALELNGYEDEVEEAKVTTGFSHHAILSDSIAPKLISLIKEGKIRKIFLVAGCDGSRASRNYYNELVEKIPKDCIILTCACGKLRFHRENYGDIEGIPRLIDLGQCNDSYSGLVIAVKLAEIFNCGVNDLPLHIILSWYEQKAVSILLTLLYLGIKNIKIGPTPPAFLSETVFNFIHEKFNLNLITTVEKDLAEFL